MQNYRVSDHFMYRFRLVVSILLIVMALQCLYFAWDNGQIVDETYYNSSGYPIVRYNDYRFLGEHPPFMMQLASLPLLLFQPKFPLQEAKRLADPNLFDLSQTGSLFLYKMGNDPYKILFAERCMVILLTLILGFVIAHWSFRLFGPLGAVISLVLYVFCPNMISHGSLFTTDMGVSALFFLTMHRLKEFFNKPSVQNLLLGGVFAGFALMSKVSGLILFPISVCVFAAAFFFKNNTSQFQPTNQTFDRTLLWLAILMFLLSLSEKIAAAALLPLIWLTVACVWKTNWNVQSKSNSSWIKIIVSLIFLSCWILCCVFIALIALKRHWSLAAALVAWNMLATVFTVVILRKKEATKGFTHCVHLIKAFAFFWFIAAVVIILGYTDFPQSLLRPVPNPFHHYIRTFNIAFSHTLSTHRSCMPNSFVTCDWKYFVTLMAIKTPLVTLVLLSIGSVLFLLGKQFSKLDKVFVLLPPVLFLLAASFLNHINIGLRHALPVYPFLFLICGSIGHRFTLMSSTARKKSLILILSLALLWHVYFVISVLPHNLSYFNELIPSVERGAQITSDSNLTWGEDNKRLALFLKKRGINSFAGALHFNNPDEFEYHQITWRSMTEEEFTEPKTGIYALDLWAYFYEQTKPQSWFKNRPPDYKVGKSIYLFKI